MDDEMLSEAVDTAVTACDKFAENLEAAAQMLKVSFWKKNSFIKTLSPNISYVAHLFQNSLSTLSVYCIFTSIRFENG